MKKLNNKKGFTLAELLIVVAIIGVLTVVAVPIFTTQLEKARENTDIANLREAKAAAASQYLTTNGAVDMYYDANKGILVDPSSKPDGYGKGTNTPGGCDSFYMSDSAVYSQTTEATDMVIRVKVSDAGEVALSWE